MHLVGFIVRKAVNFMQFFHIPFCTRNTAAFSTEAEVSSFLSMALHHWVIGFRLPDTSSTCRNVESSYAASYHRRVDT